jgi:hypothetical protein
MVTTINVCNEAWCEQTEGEAEEIKKKKTKKKLSQEEHLGVQEQ